MHLPAETHDVIVAALTYVTLETAKFLRKRWRDGSQSAHEKTVIEQHKELLEEVQNERKDCREERERDGERITELERKMTAIEGELRMEREAARIAIVSAQAHEDGRRLAEARVVELSTQLGAAHAEIVVLHGIIRVLDPEHPILTPIGQTVN